MSKKYFRDRRLLINKCLYQLTEIEWYLHSGDHPDPYVHCNQAQLKYKRWYPHRHKNGTLRNGTFKGLDYCLGEQEKEIYRSFLIRGIRNVDSGEIIEGPCKVVNHICQVLGLEAYDESFIKALKRVKWIKIKPIVQQLFYGPRIGLSDKSPEYQDRNYRYATIYTKSKRNSYIAYGSSRKIIRNKHLGNLGTNIS